MEKQIYVSGYVRNRHTQKKQDNRIGLVMLGGTVILVLIVHWQLTLAVATGISLYAFGRKYYKFVSDPGRLVVNYYGMSGTANVWHNIIEMVREGI